MKKNLILIITCFAILMLTQSFQCSSPEMTTAKIAYNNRDFQKCLTYLDKEIQKNPTNGEAWFYLSQVKQELGDVQAAATAVVEADKYLIDPKLKEESAFFKYKLWVICYNSGIEAFNQAGDSKNKKLYEKALVFFKTGKTLKPKMSDFYQLLASTYDYMGDTTNALDYYNQYAELLAPELNLAKEKKIYIGLSRTAALNSIGSPESTKGIRTSPKADSLIIDILRSGDKEIYLYSFDKANDKKFNLIGWRVNPPKDWMPTEKEQPQTFYVGAFSNSAAIYYNRKQYDKAISNVKNILTLEPTNTEANGFIVALYQETGKNDDAYNYIIDLIKADPKNYIYKATYGDMLQKNNNYDEAIIQYEDALKIEPTAIDVVVNLAVCYKNKVANIQKKQQEDFDKDPKKALKPSEYFPFLEKSVALFEKARNNAKYSRSPQIYSEIIEIYYVLNTKPTEMKTALAELEALEAIVPQEEKKDYYYKLIRIYDKYLRDTDKLKATEEKINALK